MRAPDADGRFVGLSEELRTWATSLHAACRCWPDWRIAPTNVLYGIAASWNALKGPGIFELVLSLTDDEIEWSTRASDAWDAQRRSESSLLTDGAVVGAADDVTRLDDDTRARLAGPGVRAFLRITIEWGLTDTERLALLGNSVSMATLREWHQRAPNTASADELIRLSYVLGIYEGLERLFRGAPEHGRQWLTMDRSEDPFSGVSPLEYMLSGSVDALDALRHYIDHTNGAMLDSLFPAVRRNLAASLTLPPDIAQRLGPEASDDAFLDAAAELVARDNIDNEDDGRARDGEV
jgi:hypothetical protein